MSNNDIDYPEARTTRSNALRWWALLDAEERVIYCEAHHGEERHPNTLTGREIENIYKTSIS